MKIDEIVGKIFTNLDNPAAYTSFERVYQEARRRNKKISRDDVRKQLEASRTYTLHKPRRLKFKRLKTVPNGLMTDWQADLADFQRVARDNDGYRYLLVCVDVLSRMVFTAPVKSKSPKDMIEAFEKIFTHVKVIPQKLFTDKGLEFEAKAMRDYFKRYDVLKYVAQNPDVKAAMAERTIRSIKWRLYKYFTETESYRWVDVVPKIVDGINKSVNRVTGMRPVDVNHENSDELWNRLYYQPLVKEPRYKVGDLVRISREKGVFEKGYLPNYTQEIFKIDQVKAGVVPNYRILDSAGNEITGKFYEHELSKVKQENYAVVDEVLDERRVNGKLEYLVRMRGDQNTYWVARDVIA